MRILKFILAFIVTGLLLFALVIGLNWKSFEIFMNNREAFEEGSEWVPKTQSLRGLTEYIDENPQKVSIASIVSEYPDSTLYFKEKTPRTLGSLSNIFLLTAFAIEIEAGRFQPAKLISADEIEQHQLPQIDQSLHSDGLRFAEDQGWITDDQIPLNRALELLAHFNDPVLADYLWWKLQPFNWTEFRNRFDLNQTDMPLPFSGIYIFLSSHSMEAEISELISEREKISAEVYHDEIIRLSEQYLTNTAFRDEIYGKFKDDRTGRSFMEERDALNLFPQGTAYELAHFLQTVWNRENISDSAAKRVFDWLRSPYKERSEISRDFTDYGALFDNRIGLLNGLDYGTLVYTGDTKFQAVIFDELPVGFWFHMSGNHMHQDFQQRLIYDPALIDLMIDVAEKHSIPDFN